MTDEPRPLPTNYEAEMMVLGGILARPAALEAVSVTLREEHFADDRHGAIYRGCRVLAARGETANPITLKQWAEASGAPEALGGWTYLANLAGAAATAASLALVIVDHLGKVAVPREFARHGPTAETTHVSGGLKARAVDCPVIALAQLNRAVEARDDKRPTMSDLRQSGAIEQDANAVMLLYREAYYLKARPPKREPGIDTAAYMRTWTEWNTKLVAVEREAEAALVKLRDGEPTTVRLGFDPRTISFGDAKESI